MAAPTAARTMMVLGATGRAGRLVCERALAQGWSVVSVVRNPLRLPASLTERTTVVQSDLNDRETLVAAIMKHAPNAIVDASSALPFGHAKGQQPNNADRSITLRAIVDALVEAERLPDCVLLIIGGQVIPEPGGQINSAFAATIACLLRTFIPSAWGKVIETIKWLFEDSPPQFRFVMARMGQMDEEASRGTLVPQPTHNNIQRGSASYCDVADAFVRLADDETKQWERKALFFNYR